MGNGKGNTVLGILAVFLAAVLAAATPSGAFAWFTAPTSNVDPCTDNTYFDNTNIQVLNGNSYVMTRIPITYDMAKALEAKTQGYLTIITSDEEAQNIAWLVGDSSKYVWIGLSDPNKSATYCTNNDPIVCPHDDTRFLWTNGMSLAVTGYAGWMTSGGYPYAPKNHCPAADLAFWKTCQGEHWVAAVSGAYWFDDGRHYNTVRPEYFYCKDRGEPCVSGYTWNGASARCEAPWPGCPSGDTSGNPFGAFWPMCYNGMRPFDWINMLSCASGYTWQTYSDWTGDWEFCYRSLDSLCPSGGTVAWTPSAVCTLPGNGNADVGPQKWPTLSSMAASPLTAGWPALPQDMYLCRTTSLDWLTDPFLGAYFSQYSLQNVGGYHYYSPPYVPRRYAVFEWDWVLSCSTAYSDNTVPPSLGIICWNDYNTNAIMDNNEYTQCLAATRVNPIQADMLCPYNLVQCQKTAVDPLCPVGGTYDRILRKCTADPVITCDPPVDTFLYDYPLDACVKDPVCPDNTVLNTTTDKCEKPFICPGEYTYDVSLSLCVMAPRCPPGSTYDTAMDRCQADPVYQCPAGYTLDNATKVCWHTAYCMAGTYNTSRNRCEEPPIPTCPSGYSFDNVLNRCKSNPTCPPGGDLNPSTDLCEATAIRNCPSGYSYNAGSTFCERFPDCPAGGSFVQARARCESSTYTVSCPAGYVDNGFICRAAVTCPYGGSFRSDLDICEITVSIDCPRGTYDNVTWVQYGNVCRKYYYYYYWTMPAYTFWCHPPGSTGDVSCAYGPWHSPPASYPGVTTYTGPAYDYTPCPYNGTVKNEAAPWYYNYQLPNRCQKPPLWADCPPGFPFNATSGKCEADALPCPPGSYPDPWYGGFCKADEVWSCHDNTYTKKQGWPATACPDTQNCTCYKDPYESCPVGSQYDYLLDRCVTRKSPLTQCPSGYRVGQCPDTPRYYDLNYGTWQCEGEPCAKPGVVIDNGAGYVCRDSLSQIQKRCPAGYTNNIALGRCEYTVSSYTCPYHYYYYWAGYVPTNSCGNAAIGAPYPQFDAITGRCSWGDNVMYCGNTAYSYVCSYYSPYTYDATRNTCATPVGIACPAGVNVTWDNTGTRMCISGYECDTGYTYNAAMDMCEKCAAGYTLDNTASPRDCRHAIDPGRCAAGTTYDNTLRKCVKPGPTGENLRCEMDPVCPALTSYDNTWDRCTSPRNDVCPSNFSTQYMYNYPSYSGNCKAISDPVCPAGGALPGVGGTRGDVYPYYYYCQGLPTYSCPTGYSWNWALARCTASPFCPVGSSYDNTTDQCTSAATMVCPSGYAPDNVLRICTGVPNCPYGGSFVGTFNRCEADACPANYLYNAGNGFCETGVSCLFGGTYGDPAGQLGYNTCYTMNPTLAPCPTGYLSDVVCNPADSCATNLDVCLGSPYCPPGGSQNGSICQAPRARFCPSMYTYRAVGDVCYAPYTCLPGTAFDGAWCSMVITAPGCPVPYTQTGVSGLDLICSVAPECPAGGTFSAAALECRASATNCPDSYSWDGFVCSATATCGAGGTLDILDHRCERAIDFYECPVGMVYDITIAKCAAPATCYTGGSLNYGGDINLCGAAFTARNCPANYWYDGNYNLTGYTGGICFAGIICPTTTYWNANGNLSGVPWQSAATPAGGCFGGKNPSCYWPSSYGPYPYPPGTYWDSPANSCSATPTCPDGGKVDPNTNRCQILLSNLTSGSCDNGWRPQQPTCPSHGYAPYSPEGKPVYDNATSQCYFRLPWGYYYWSCPWYTGWWWNGDASANGKCLAYPTVPADNTACTSDRICMPRAKTTTPYPSWDNSVYWCQDPELTYNTRNQRIAPACSSQYYMYDWGTSLESGYTDPNNRRCRMSAYLTCPSEAPYGCYGPNGIGIPNQWSPGCYSWTCGRTRYCPDNASWYDQNLRKCLKAPLSVQCTDNVNQYYPIFDNVAIMCYTPMDFLCSPGQYSPYTGYCETPVVRSCPPMYIYNAGRDKCERAPYCTPAYKPSGLESSFASPYVWDNTTEKYKRPADNNASCIDLSFGAVLWTDNTSNKWCLMNSAGWYDPAKDNCYANPIYTCLPGYTWDNSANICTAPYNCINGGLLNTTYGVCQAYPTYYCQTSDYTFNISTRMCQAVPSCMTPGAYDPLSNYCLANVVWQCRNPLILDNALAVCWISAQCYPGGSLNGSTDRCEATPTITCPAGTPNYDASAKVCWSDPECPGVDPSCPSGEIGPQTFGALPPPQNTYLMCYNPVSNSYHSPTYGRPGTLNRDRNVCSLGPTELCGLSLAYTLDTTTVPYWTCQADPPCPAGSVYDNAANTCVAPATHTCPSDVFTYNPANRLCEADHLGCGSGVMDNVTGLCDMGFSTCPKGQQFPCMTVANSGCPAGYTVHPTDNVCTAAAPSCAAPGTLDATKKICVSTLTLDSATACSVSQPCVKDYRNFLCQDAGSSYDAVYGKCLVPASLKTSCGAGDTCVDTYSLWHTTCVTKYNARWSTSTSTQVILEPPSNTDYLYTSFCGDNNAANMRISGGCAHGALGTDCGPCMANFTGVGKCATRVNHTVYWGRAGAGYYEEICDLLEAVDDNTLVCPAATTNYCTPTSKLADLCCYNVAKGEWKSRTSQVLGSAPVCALYSEVGSCDSGYTFAAASPSPTLCRNNMDNWGNLTGFSDCDNPAAYRCTKSVGIACPAGYTPYGTAGKCAKDPDCPPGFTWDNTVLSAQECNDLYAAWGNRTGIDNCLDPGKLRCTRDLALKCPAGYVADQGTGDCWTVPKCPSTGTYDLVNDRCIAPNNGIAYCSDALCADSKETEETPTTPGGDNVLSSMDNCAGIVKIFSGTDSRCRTRDIFACSFSGLGCCTKEKVCGGVFKCSETEIKVKNSVNNKLCHLIGNYCSKKLKGTGTCVQKKNTYCCFKSKLGRIIQEQARPQLKWDWGTPTAPNCRGFTAEDFQMIDFTSLDLSEFYADVKAKVGTAVSNKLDYQLQNFQNQVNFK